MKQLLTVLQFEFLNYAKNKIFIWVTLGAVLAIAGVLSFPRIAFLFEKDNEAEVDIHKSVIAIQDKSGADPNEILNFLIGAMPNQSFVIADGSEEALKEDILNEKYAGAIVIKASNQYLYIVNNVSMMDTTAVNINNVLTERYRQDEMKKLGVSLEESNRILTATISGETIQIGKNQMDSFMYTYVMIFVLYMAIIMYGQLVATSVAAEKSTRAMEVLITSAKPVNLIFGKVIGAGLAGLFQMFIIFGSSFVFYNFNKDLWGNNEMIQSIFGMPLPTLVYALLFFILGYFIYTFIYGALGSLATKTEDINTSTMPITLIFVAAFMIVMFSMTGGTIDSPLMTAASYIPFTSPMAMFARITMGEVKAIEIIISIVILIISTIGIGYASAKIYKRGVLHYGKAPKLLGLFKSNK